MSIGISTKKAVFIALPLIAALLLYFQGSDSLLETPKKVSSTPMLETNTLGEQGRNVAISEEDVEVESFEMSTDGLVTEQPDNHRALIEQAHIAELVSQLPPDAKETWRLHELKKTVSTRLDNLQADVITESELKDLFDDIDHLDNKRVFLPDEAASLKRYVRGLLRTQ